MNRTICWDCGNAIATRCPVLFYRAKTTKKLEQTLKTLNVEFTTKKDSHKSTLFIIHKCPFFENKRIPQEFMFNSR